MSVALSAANTIQKGITASVEISAEATPEQREIIKQRLSASELVDSVKLLTREEKSSDEEFRAIFATEYEEVLGENPLRDSYELTLTSEASDDQLLTAFINRAMTIEGVEHVSCPVGVIDKMYATINAVKSIFILFGAALLFVSLVLLSNTIRLAIYSKRYLINTMKLVGATKLFIMRPFLASATTQGALAGVISSLLFAIALWGITGTIPEIASLASMTHIAVIVGVMIFMGVVISVIFTTLALNKFINMKSNKIHLY